MRGERFKGVTRYVGSIAGGQVVKRGPLMDVVHALHLGYIGHVPCYIRRPDDRAFVIVIPRSGVPTYTQELGGPVDPPAWVHQTIQYLTTYTKAGAA